jgi:ABC-2 type transport system permease protein
MMNLLRIKAITKKEFIQICRDPRSLAMAIAIPMLLLILFGFALTLDVDNVRLAVWNQDRSQVSNDFIRNFSSSRYFKIIGFYDNYADLLNLIDTNKALMVMVIPVDFAKLLRSGRTAPVQLLVDGSDSNTATIAIGYAGAIVSGYNVRLTAETASGSGIEIPGPVNMLTRIWYNEELKSRNFIVPGLIAMIIMIIAALLTSLTIVRERERGTMEQLISTPVKTYELIIGKFLPYFIIGFLDMLIAVSMGQFMYHVPLRGSLALLFALSSLFLTGSLMLGMFISCIATNQLMASQLAMLSTFLPGFLLSGFAFAISNMPKPIQIITYIVPARYFIKILRGIYLKGVGMRILWVDVLLLATFTAAMVTLTLMKFKKKAA